MKIEWKLFVIRFVERFQRRDSMFAVQFHYDYCAFYRLVKELEVSTTRIKLLNRNQNLYFLLLLPLSTISK